MLQAIRDRAQGIFAWIMLIVVGVPFALWGIQNYMETDKEAPVVTVGDKDIFERDVNRAFEQSMASLVGLQQFDEAWLRRESKERLIRQELLIQDARKRGLVISDDSIRSVIQEMPYFQTDGHFDNDKYKLALSSQGMNGQGYAAEVGQALMVEQYQKGLLETDFVPAAIVDDFIKYRNQERQIEYVTIPKVVAKENITEEALQAYFNANLANYQNPEKLAVYYVMLDRNKLAVGLKPTDEELRAMYEEQISQFSTPERRKISHILFAIDTSKADSDSSALKKAQQARLRLIDGEDFGKVAKELSDDKASAQKGGDLGFVTKDAFDPNVIDAAASLQQGEISEPVKSPFGYHLIKVTDLEPGAVKPFETVRSELEKLAQNVAAESRFYELSQTLAEQSFEHPDSLETAASAVGAEVQSTDLFTRAEGKEAASEEVFRKAAFSQDVLDGKNSEPVEIGTDKVAVLHLKERIPASAKTFAEVRASIESVLEDQAAVNETRKRAQEILADAKSGKPLAEIVKSLKLSLSKSEFFRRNDAVLNRPLVNGSFKIASTSPQSSLTLVELANGDQALIHLLGIKDGETKSADAKEVDAVRAFLLKSASQSEMSSYMAGMRAEGEVHERAPKP